MADIALAPEMRGKFEGVGAAVVRRRGVADVAMAEKTEDRPRIMRGEWESEELETDEGPMAGNGVLGLRGRPCSARVLHEILQR